jgi:hypothetical protein
MRGWRAEKAQTCGVAVPCVDRAGASRRATCAQAVKALAHAILRCLSGAGPCFQVFDRRSSSEAVAQTKSLQASSWQGLLVVPEGAPTPPECMAASQTRGRRTSSRLHDASRQRPSTDEVMRSVPGAREAGISLSASYQRKPVLFGASRRWIPAFTETTDDSVLRPFARAGRMRPLQAAS